MSNKKKVIELVCVLHSNRRMCFEALLIHTLRDKPLFGTTYIQTRVFVFLSR